MGKVITTADSRRERMDITPEAPRRGPMTGRGPETPQEFCGQHATAGEWSDFRERVEERMGEQPKHVWRRCSRCGFTTATRWGSNPGNPCPLCNAPGYETGGKMADMNKGEVKVYLREKAKRDAEQGERRERAAFEELNTQRRKEGRAELSRKEWDALQVRLEAERRETDKRMAAAWKPKEAKR